MGLPPPYKNVIINFDSMSLDTLTLDLIITHLLNEEVQQITQVTVLPTPFKEKDLNWVMAVFCAKLVSEVWCHFCDGKGHYKSDCPERTAWEKSKKPSKGTAAAAAWESSDNKCFWLWGCMQIWWHCTCGGVLKYSSAFPQVIAFR